jgi:hypothetical protein
MRRKGKEEKQSGRERERRGEQDCRVAAPPAMTDQDGGGGGGGGSGSFSTSWRMVNG